MPKDTAHLPHRDPIAYCAAKHCSGLSGRTWPDTETQTALKIALREIDRAYRTTQRNVMAEPRAEELRAARLAELERTATVLGWLAA